MFSRAGLPQSVLPEGDILHSPVPARSDFYAYPNPSQDRVSIGSRSGAPVVAVEIYDLHGRKVMAASSPELYIGHLESGIYCLVVRTGTGSTTIKLVKK